MGSRYDVEVTVSSASSLKNVNWRNGALRPYVVLWVDDGPKCSTRVAAAAAADDTDNPVWDWDDTLLVPLPPSSRLDDAVLHLDVVHAADPAEDCAKPLVGSARLPLRDVLDDAGLGGARAPRTLQLKRPSGRPQGRVDVQLRVRDRQRDAYPAPGAGVPASYYGQQGAPAPAYGQPPYVAPPAGYPAGAYGGGYGGAPAAAAAPYGAAAPPAAAAYGAAPAPAQKSGGKMGMGTGLAVGAAAGLLGGLAIAEGASYLEDKIEDDVAEKVEEDTFGGDDGDYDDDY